MSSYLKKLAFSDKRLSECRIMSAVLLSIVVWQGYHYSDILSKQPVRLIPQYGSGPYFNTQKSSDADAEYLKTIFMGDVLNYMNFSPQTIVNQYQQFIVRLAPNLAAKSRYELIAFAEKIQKNNRNFQRFYVENVAFISKNNHFYVGAKGKVETFDGSVSQGKKDIVILFEYINLGGIPKISSIKKEEVNKDDSLLKVIGKMIGAKAIVGDGVAEILKEEEKEEKAEQKETKIKHIKRSKEI